jgi:Helix-turn-helix domain
LPQVSSVPQLPLSPKQELLILDNWQRSGLPARDFSALVNVSRHTLYSWKKRFEEEGTAGLTDRPKGAQTGSKLPELTKRTILMLKQAHPEAESPADRQGAKHHPPLGIPSRTDDCELRVKASVSDSQWLQCTP